MRHKEYFSSACIKNDITFWEAGLCVVIFEVPSGSAAAWGLYLVRALPPRVFYAFNEGIGMIYSM